MAEDNIFTRTISTAEFSDTPRLVLEQPTGKVRVEAWDKPEIEVSIPSTSGMFEVEQSGSTVTIVNRPGKFKMVNFLEPAAEELNNIGIDLERVAARVERKVERGMRRMGKGWNVNIDLGHWGAGRDYGIRVPYNCHLTLRTSSGDVEVHDVKGTHFLQTTNGDIRLTNVGGNALVNTASGDIRIEKLEGKLAVRSASGDLLGRRMALEEVSANTASGDVSFEMVSVPERECEFRSVSGDVSLSFPSDARLTLDINTLTGDISSGFSRKDVGYESNSRRHTTLTVNGGGIRARVATVSGDVTIRPTKVRSDVNEASTGEPTMDLSRGRNPEEAPGAQQDRRREAELEILQSVERGELSPQEAMQRLNELGRR